MRERFAPRELITIGDVGALEGDLSPASLLVDLEYQFPFLYRALHKGEAPPADEPPEFPLWAVATVGVSVGALLVTWLVTRKARPNPRRRRRK